MKKTLIIAFILVVLNIAYITGAETTSVQPLDFCLRKYEAAPVDLYFKSLAAINENNHTIKELQSRAGYILFESNNCEYLLSVVPQSEKTSLVKISPMDGNYARAMVLTKNLFNRLDNTAGLQVMNRGRM